MPLVPIHIKVELPYSTNLPEDVTTNTFNVIVDSVDDDPADVSGIAALFVDFYLVAAPSTVFPAPIGGPINPTVLESFLSPVMSTEAEACSVTPYVLSMEELAADHVGTPEEATLFTLPGNGDDGLPPDVHAALHFGSFGRGSAAVEVGNTRPKQRRTGHIKFGPVNVSAMETAGTATGRPLQNFRLSLIAAAKKLQEDLEGMAESATLAIWSRSDNAFRSVQTTWCDNAFDNVETRKHKPTVRNVINIAPPTTFAIDV